MHSCRHAGIELVCTYVQIRTHVPRHVCRLRCVCRCVCMNACAMYLLYIHVLPGSWSPASMLSNFLEDLELRRSGFSPYAAGFRSTDKKLPQILVGSAGLRHFEAKRKPVLWNFATDLAFRGTGPHASCVDIVCRKQDATNANYAPHHGGSRVPGTPVARTSYRHIHTRPNQFS